VREVSAVQAAQDLLVQLQEHRCFMLAAVEVAVQLVEQVEVLLVATGQILL
jgi:hypothetical protein